MHNVYYIIYIKMMLYTQLYDIVILTKYLKKLNILRLLKLFQCEYLIEERGIFNFQYSCY